MGSGTVYYKEVAHICALFAYHIITCAFQLPTKSRTSAKTRLSDSKPAFRLMPLRTRFSDRTCWSGVETSLLTLSTWFRNKLVESRKYIWENLVWHTGVLWEVDGFFMGCWWVFMGCWWVFMGGLWVVYGFAEMQVLTYLWDIDSPRKRGKCSDWVKVEILSNMIERVENLGKWGPGVKTKFSEQKPGLSTCHVSKPDFRVTSRLFWGHGGSRYIYIYQDRSI